MTERRPNATKRTRIVFQETWIVFLPFGPEIRDGGRVNPKNFGFFRERYDNLAYNLANGGDQGWL
jgi:hypothetical protein